MEQGCKCDDEPEMSESRDETETLELPTDGRKS